MGRTKIEWCEATWNPVTGCTKIAPGCKHCYAEKMARRLRAMGQARYANGFTVTLHPEALEEPLQWKKLRRVFVCSMSDLFHRDVPTEFIVKVFMVMAMSQQHTYQILTKRPERMADVCRQKPWFAKGVRSVKGDNTFCCSYGVLPNVWLGTSVESQEAADKRIPWLLKCPAAVRFLSCEPLLGPVDLDSEEANHVHALGCGNSECECSDRGVDWVIVGAESKGAYAARECKIEWVHAIVDQCCEAGVPVFVKQLQIGNRISKDPAEWPKGLRVREYPRVGD